MSFSERPDEASLPPPLPAAEPPPRPPELPRGDAPPALPPLAKKRFQYSISNLMVVILLVAIAAAAMGRAMRGDKVTGTIIAIMAPVALIIVLGVWKSLERLYRNWRRP